MQNSQFDLNVTIYGRDADGNLTVPMFALRGIAVQSPANQPHVISAVIKGVEPSIVVVDFDQDIEAPDYRAGWTVMVNGNPVILTDAQRRDTFQYELRLSLPNYVSDGDVVTLAYDANAGGIVSQASETPLESFLARAIQFTA